MSSAAMRKVLAMIDAAGGEYYRQVLEARSEYLRLRLQSDREIRRIYEQAAQEIANKLRSLPSGPLTPGGELVKRYYEELDRAIRHQIEIAGRKLEDRFRGLIAETFDVTSRPVIEATTELLEKAGKIAGFPFDRVKIQRGFAEVNARAVEAYLAQTRHGLYLSDRIWDVADGAGDAMRDILRTSIAYGEDPVAVARRLEQYVREGSATFSRDYTSMMERMKGRVPGDLSYEALRLARTEMSSAAMEAVYAAGQASPSYQGVKWVLSNAHPVPDVCDELATADLFGMGPGVYKKGYEPPHPHPNCLCVATPLAGDLDTLVDDLRAWLQDPDSRPELERWYQKTYLGKSRMPAKRKSMSGQVPDWCQFINPDWLDKVELYSLQETCMVNMAARHGLSLDEYKRLVTEKINKIIENSDLCVRAWMEDFESIITDGRYKTQFETMTSAGLLDNHARAIFEKAFFGYPMNLDPVRRPIYGYLEPGKIRPHRASSQVVKQYGDVVFKLKPRVYARTTFTFGDTLDETQVGSKPVFSPVRLIRRDNAWSAVTYQSYAEDPLIWANGREAERAVHYIEAQIHGGGFTLSDIEEIIFTGSAPNPELQALLRQYKLRWRVVQ